MQKIIKFLNVWCTGVYFAIILVMMVACGVVVSFLLHNFKFTAGDFIEKYLVQVRNIVSGFWWII